MSNSEDVQLHYFTLQMLLDGEYQRFASEEEKINASKFRAEEDRLMSLLSHGFLRSVLAGDLGRDSAEVRLSHNPNGKPVLWGSGKRVHFNLSHSGTSGLCAISHENEVGVDLEAVRPFLPGTLEGLIEDCFTPQEKTILECLSPEKKLDLFFRFWVRKEATVKAMGTGLAFPLNLLDVSDISQQPVLIRGVEPEELCLTVRDISVPAPYVAALCLKYDVSITESQVA